MAIAYTTAKPHLSPSRRNQYIHCLTKLGNRKILPKNPKVCIAGNLQLLTNYPIEECCALMRSYSRDWEYHSPSHYYPIPISVLDTRLAKRVSPIEAITYYPLWVTNEYGYLRYKLCLYLAYTLQKEVDINAKL